jgi:hypothetical protein
MKINHAIKHCGTLFALCRQAAQISFREAPQFHQGSRETNKNRASLGDARFFPADAKCFLSSNQRKKSYQFFSFLISVAEKNVFSAAILRLLLS